MTGNTPTMSPRAAEAYLDFVSGARAELMHRQWGALLSRGGHALTQAEQRTGKKPESVAAVKETLLKLPEMAAFLRIKRTLQESCWRRILEYCERYQASFIKELDESDRSRPGSVEWDPGFHYPEYSTVDIHIQPGGYTRHVLAGLIYDQGTKVFFGNDKNGDSLHDATAEKTAIPQDGAIGRIMEIGCSIGQMTCSLKKRFPEAEVWGTDISSPMVRYAHWRAVQKNLDVHFSQMPAEKLDFPDDQFDLVVAHILFHELPVEIIDDTLTEVFRVLRPGGTFVVWDFPTASAANPSFANFMGILDAADNGEPYAVGFVKCGLEERMKRSGFVLRYEQAEKLMEHGRVGDKPE